MFASGHRKSLIFENRDIDLPLIKLYLFYETTI